MSPIAPALERLGAEVARLTAGVGRRVEAAALGVSDRAGQLALFEPGLVSANRACRLVRARDGWIAVNLAREEDRELVPAWTLGDSGEDPWRAIETSAAARGAEEMIDGAALLGLPAARVGEVVCDDPAPPLVRCAPGDSARAGTLKVVDLSALWAGPMCGAILAAMGADTVKIESPRRPDPTRVATPEFFRRLNGGKSELALDLASTDGQAALREHVAGADVLVTGARPRAFDGLGLAPGAVFEANPRLTWVAITGYGWTGAAASRVAFGDDAAAAGGLVRWTADREPRFIGDALADPVTGLAAAIGALRGMVAGGGVLVDVAMARCAAAAAQLCGLARP